MAQPGNKPVFAPWNDPDEKPLIQFKNVTKKFGEFVAIDDLTLDIYAAASSLRCSDRRAAARPR